MTSGEETRHGNGASTGSLSHGPTSLYAEVSEPEIYTEPNTASNGHAERAADHSITNPDYSYAVPEQTTTPTPAEALQNHYEFALYVPTKVYQQHCIVCDSYVSCRLVSLPQEQRQQATDHSNVYATLEEVFSHNIVLSVTSFHRKLYNPLVHHVVEHIVAKVTIHMFCVLC